ncbi:nucleotide-binding universal stress UspA family protein [Streptomyces sp. V3I8]|uniref:universal stress protein n=1 Tax=Streptomyces sp. V3I8 TaxID=3042279 RepID=UPI002787D790|nr:universal stress protein [Streptomyces sp. V3I8]MDQ1034452.1 nucleotide-binding universal stress UspA family protein [Streptomyces sp. V3I8]
MTRTVTVGLDGSPESRAAVEWAAREAKLRGCSLKIFNVWEPVPQPMVQAPVPGAETHQHWTERIPRDTADGVRSRHPGVEVVVEQAPGQAAEILSEVAKAAELLVLGSRGIAGGGKPPVPASGTVCQDGAERPGQGPNRLSRPTDTGATVKSVPLLVKSCPGPRGRRWPPWTCP